MSLQQVS
jgi:hypothetical protein